MNQASHLNSKIILIIVMINNNNYNNTKTYPLNIPGYYNNYDNNHYY